MKFSVSMDSRFVKFPYGHELHPIIQLPVNFWSGRYLCTENLRTRELDSLKKNPAIPPVKNWSIKKGDYLVCEKAVDIQKIRFMKKFVSRLILFMAIIISALSACIMGVLLSRF